jgi:predicted nucleic acid-binding protein
MAKGGKIQIVLDADVVIHFSKGGLLSLLPRIFPDYEYVLLEAVHEELLSDIRTQIDHQMALLKNITLLPFAPRGEMLREYAMLRSRFGKGESACMAYCLFTHNVIGSSNLRDIRTYCQEKQITYLTTMDFLWYAWRKHLMTTDEVKTFMNEVRSKGSKLPEVDIEKYVCETVL